MTEKENALKELESVLENGQLSADYEQLLEATNKMDSLRNALDELFEEWVSLQNE